MFNLNELFKNVIYLNVLIMLYHHIHYHFPAFFLPMDPGKGGFLGRDPRTPQAHDSPGAKGGRRQRALPGEGLCDSHHSAALRTQPNEILRSVVGSMIEMYYYYL